MRALSVCQSLSCVLACALCLSVCLSLSVSFRFVHETTVSAAEKMRQQQPVMMMIRGMMMVGVRLPPRVAVDFLSTQSTCVLTL